MSKTKEPRKEEILKTEIDEITAHRTFNPPKNSETGNRIVRLRAVGEKVIGILGWPITNFREATSYPMQLESGEVIEILGNRLLHKQIREGELSGQKVEIVFQGREYFHGGRGHYRKIYRVYKYVHKGMSRKEWEKLLADVRKVEVTEPV